jgi:hypothetical protein
MKRKKKFKSEVMSGHKDSALEVPFDPTKEWGIEPKPLWRGRRGHSINAIVNGLRFESCIVPRQKKFFLLIDGDTANSAGISEGSVVEVSVEPSGE